MKTKINNRIKKGLTVFTMVLAVSFSAFSTTPEGDFKILKQKNGIDLYYRWMQMPEGKQVRQMKAVFEVSATTEDLLNLLKDEKKALDWIPSAEQFRNLTKVNGTDWVSYIQFSIPWPFADQDCILEYSIKSSTPTETWIEFRTNPDYIGTVEGMGRMKDIVGAFVVHPLPNGHSLLECYFLSTKASKIPRWITEPIITGNILSLMDSLRNELSNV